MRPSASTARSRRSFSEMGARCRLQSVCAMPAAGPARTCRAKWVHDAGWVGFPDMLGTGPSSTGTRWQGSAASCRLRRSARRAAEGAATSPHLVREWPARHAPLSTTGTHQRRDQHQGGRRTGGVVRWSTGRAGSAHNRGLGPAELADQRLHLGWHLVREQGRASGPVDQGVQAIGQSRAQSGSRRTPVRPTTCRPPVPREHRRGWAAPPGLGARPSSAGRLVCHPCTVQRPRPLQDVVKL